MAKMLAQMLEGTFVSLQLFGLTLLLALPLGLVVALGRMSRNRWLCGAVNAYMLVMRGTPLILQLIFIYFAPYYLFGASFDRFAAAVAAFSINYAAYFGEIMRGALESIPAGQHEAGKVLGFTRAQVFFRIALPQAAKRALPAMGNEVITLVKDTALAQTIGVAELFRVAQTASSRQFSTVPIFVAGLFYFAMNWAVAHAFARMERKLGYYR